MKVLCAVASRHGSTIEVGQFIAKELANYGLDTTFKLAQDVKSLDGYDALVFGSAVYMTQWVSEARDFIRRFAVELRTLPVWAFSLGLSGVTDGEVRDPMRIGPVMVTIDPVDYQTFAGKLDPSQLNLRERSIARIGGASEGDYRDFTQIQEWTAKVAQQIKERLANKN